MEPLYKMEANPTSNKNTPEILRGLHKAYPNAECALSHRSPWELLIATILSAQCTDARVNMVTPALFKAYPNPEALGKAPLPDVEDLIKTTGFFRQKAKSVVMTSRMISQNFGGEVPKKMEDLLSFRGVARKTANVVLGTAYGLAEGVVVDTHVRRVSNRLGFTRHKDPVKIEKDLMKLLPREDWIWFSHALITHGRKICRAPLPRCPDCMLTKWCPSSRV